MGNEAYKLLLHGIDTLQCAYYFDFSSASRIDFARLYEIKEGMRNNRFKDPVPVTIGDSKFLLSPHGTASGYPFLMSNEDFKVEFGEFNNPSFFVTFKSQALWRDSAFELHAKFQRWAGSVDLVPHKPETISRVDYCFDYHLENIDFDEDCFVSRTDKDSQYRENGKVQTFSLGRGDVVLRVYDKVAEISQQSEKVWFFLLWEQDKNVWRIEWQVRKAILRQFGIKTFEELKYFQGDLLRYLAEDHTTLRIPNGDLNRGRWPLHPLWFDLQEKIAQLDHLGICRVLGKSSALEERMIRIAIAVYGYLKATAAVDCVRGKKGDISADEALRVLSDLMWKIHDPLHWQNEVRKRIEAIECGEW